MSIRLKAEDRIDHFVVRARLDEVSGNPLSSRYGAADVETNSPAEIWSYNTPGSTSKGFTQYKTSRRSLLRRLEAHSEAAQYVIRIHGVSDDIPVRGLYLIPN